MAVKYGGWWAPKPVDTTFVPEPMAMNLAMQQRGQQQNVQLPGGVELERAPNVFDEPEQLSAAQNELLNFYSKYNKNGYHPSDIKTLMLKDWV